MRKVHRAELTQLYLNFMLLISYKQVNENLYRFNSRFPFANPCYKWVGLISDKLVYKLYKFNEMHASMCIEHLQMHCHAETG